MELKLTQKFELQHPDVTIGAGEGMLVPPAEALSATDIPFFTASIEQDRALLCELTMAGARRRWGVGGERISNREKAISEEGVPKDVRDRLDYELDVIQRQEDVVSYLLIVQDFVAEARKAGAVVGPGRGAVAGSMVAYALGITSVNPLQHDLLFERFINPDRIVHPWIMVDMDEEGRNWTLRYLTRRYGRDHLALIGTVNGAHDSGIVLSRGKMADRVPITISSGNALPVMRYDELHVETVGPIRIDLFGMKELSIIRRCVQAVRESTGDEIDLEAVPLDDPDVFDLFGRGDTDGVLQFDSNDMRKWLYDLKPTAFASLVALNALNSPWLKEEIPHYVARCKGKEPIAYAHPLLEPYLAETCGLTVYQEQIMLAVRRLAGFTRGQAARLRKALGKKQSRILDELRPMFVTGCLENPDFRIGDFKVDGSAKDCAEDIWRGWICKGPYAVCKAHAVSYTRLAYRLAYLKSHYKRIAACETARCEHGEGV